MPLANGENVLHGSLPARMASRRLNVGEFITQGAGGQAVRVRHQPTYEALALSVSGGCQLCAVLQRGIFDESLLNACDWSATVERHQRLDSLRSEGYSFSAYYIQDRDRDAPYFPGERGYYRVHYDRPGDVWQVRGGMQSLSLFSWYDRDYIARPIAPLPDFNLCRDWIDTCASRHYKCPAIKGRELPARLLDVGSLHHDSKLVETQGQVGEYVTLTHSWGGQQPPKTTAGNYTANMKAISFASLPRTFQDAIVAVRKLGFRYLWIDCFCIIQGDAADFQRECARMAQIFENSTLTIAGAAAHNPYAGFLHKRTTEEVLPCKLTRRVDGMNMENFFMCNKQHWYRRHFFKGSESPLASRVWILQERQRSPRILYFGSKQIYFECMEVNCWESIRYAAPKGTHDDAVKRAFNMELVLGSFYNVWYYIVSDYTTRQLTAESDKLPALSGTAHRMQSRIEDEYLAGLWRKDLPNGLLWYADTENETQNSLIPASKRAPSWSWASSDRHVTFPTVGSLLTQGFDAKVRHHFAITHAEATAVGVDLFGEVHVGLLTLDGKTRKGLIRRYWDAEEEEYVLDLCSGDDSADQAAFLPDAVKSSFSGIPLDTGKPVVAMFMATVTRAKEVSAIGLVLEMVDTSKQILRRIRIASFECEALPEGEDLPRIPAWFEGCSRQTVRII